MQATFVTLQIYRVPGSWPNSAVTAITCFSVAVAFNRVTVAWINCTGYRVVVKARLVVMAMAMARAMRANGVACAEDSFSTQATATATAVVGRKRVGHHHKVAVQFLHDSHAPPANLLRVDLHFVTNRIRGQRRLVVLSVSEATAVVCTTAIAAAAATTTNNNNFGGVARVHGCCRCSARAVTVTASTMTMVNMLALGVRRAMAFIVVAVVIFQLPGRACGGGLLLTTAVAGGWAASGGLPT